MIERLEAPGPDAPCQGRPSPILSTDNRADAGLRWSCSRRRQPGNGI